MALPIDTSCEAQYEDGYIHSETDLGDTSPYDPTQNVLNDIIEKRPERDHGKMVRFSVFYKDARYDVDWTDLPDNARPIRFRNYSADLEAGTGRVINQRVNWVKFGYQYNKSGKNFKEVREL